MPLPRKGLYRIQEMIDKWQITESDLACYALKGQIRISVAVTEGVFASTSTPLNSGGTGDSDPYRWNLISGIRDLCSYDAWDIHKNRWARVKRFVPEHSEDICTIVQPHDGYYVEAADLLLRAEEIDRFEVEQIGEAREVGAVGAALTRGMRGSPPKHSWEGGLTALLAHVHVNGSSETRADYVRVMEDWFATQPVEPPDQRTVEKKVSNLFRQIDKLMSQSDPKMRDAIRGRK